MQPYPKTSLKRNVSNLAVCVECGYYMYFVTSSRNIVGLVSADAATCVRWQEGGGGEVSKLCIKSKRKEMFIPSA